MTIFTTDVENFFRMTMQKKVNFFSPFIYFFHPRLMPIALFRISAFFYRNHFVVLANIFSVINQICFGLEISPKVKVGKGFFMPHCRATVIGANEIGDHVTIYQNVTIGAKYLDFSYDQSSRPRIGNNVVIGTGATVLGPITVSDGVRIGPHSLVNQDLPIGTRFSHVDIENKTSPLSSKLNSKPQVVNFREIGDARGLLVAIEGIKDIPFEIKRIYYIFNTKSQVRRGSHAHRNLNQVAIAVRGSCKFLIDDGKCKSTFTLDHPSKGLLLSGFLWREMHDFSDDCVLLVVADQYYDENDYIRVYDDFIKVVNQHKD